MLNELFPRAHVRYAAPPLLGPIADGFAAWLVRQGYTRRSLRLQLQSVEVSHAIDVDRAFSALTTARAEALTVVTSALTLDNRVQIASLALKNRIPSIFGQPASAEAGGLMAYGSSALERMRHAATYVDRILKGAKPGDLPVEQPTKFELVINMKTAKALGLTLPPSLLRRADQVLQ